MMVKLSLQEKLKTFVIAFLLSYVASASILFMHQFLGSQTTFSAQITDAGIILFIPIVFPVFALIASTREIYYLFFAIAYIAVWCLLFHFQYVFENRLIALSVFMTILNLLGYTFFIALTPNFIV